LRIGFISLGGGDALMDADKLETGEAPGLFRLDDQVVVVTGGAGLYGFPISEALAEAGGQVIVASRNTTKNEAAAAELSGRGLKVCALPLDMGREESVRELDRLVIERFGRIDVLINNAVSRPVRDFWEATEKEWEESLRINVAGIHFCSRVIAEGMLRRGYGNIVNISSIYGIVAPTFLIYRGTGITCPPDYAFHKAGIINYTRYLAVLLAPAIRVNCLSLGGLGTEDEDEEFVRRYSERCPLGRKAEVDDVKGPIVFLASRASRYMTGHNLVVDGGWTAS
jgi:NAD(P)-dependent dehydrogenase (short-subunit alcohol dehydrogenase family)